jgi:hypothetical protein
MVTVALVGAMPVRAVGAADLDVTRVINRVQGATAPGKDMRATIEFEIVNAKGERVHWGGSYYRRGAPDARMRLVLDSPVDLRGTEVVLSPGPDRIAHQRLYVPALRRVRDLQADMRGESFLGTDFNYEDLGVQQLDFQQQTLSEGVLWKIRTLQGIKTIKSYPTATVITMQTVPAGTLTRITLSDIEYDTGLADVLFEGPHE